MSYVFQYLKFTFTAPLFSTIQSLFANSTMLEHITAVFDDAPLIAATIFKVISTVGTATNIKGNFQRHSNFYDDIHINISGTDFKHIELPVGLDLLDNIVSDICYINRNR